LVKNICFDKSFVPKALSVLPDLNSNGFSEIAVLGVSTATGETRAEVRDAKTGSIIRSIGFTKNFQPRAPAIVSDINSNLSPELAELGVEKAGEKARIELRDSLSKTIVETIPIP
jgi:hypothetical protein